MKKLFIIFFFVIFSIFLFSQTQVSGNQSGVWEIGSSPYQVVGTINVLAGNTLTIQAGVVVQFMGHYQFVVHGSLQAIGTEQDSIFFTTNNPNVGWGGIRFDSSEDISNLSYCRIEYGKSSGSYPDVHGGAVALLNSNAHFHNCVFAYNNADTGEDGMGGAVYAYNTNNSTIFENCTFIGNHAYGEGGAIKFTSDMGTHIINCKFLYNNANYGGGAISLYSVNQTKITKCLFANNYTEYSSGGAIHTLGIGNNFILENCTITQNSANHGDGGAISLAYANVNIVNSIIYNNPGLYSDGIYMDYTSSAEINYSDIQMPDGANGTHNINQNPLFVDPDNNDFHLMETSPCIDAGTDIGLDYFGEAPDMGCFEWMEGTNTNENVVSNNDLAIKIYPNPFLNSFYKNQIEIEFYIKTKKLVTINIYDLKGRLVKKLVSKTFSAGNHKLYWNFQNNIGSGIYFIKIATDKNIKIIKFSVIK